MLEDRVKLPSACLLFRRRLQRSFARKHADAVELSTKPVQELLGRIILKGKTADGYNLAKAIRGSDDKNDGVEHSSYKDTTGRGHFKFLSIRCARFHVKMLFSWRADGARTCELDSIGEQTHKSCEWMLMRDETGWV
eukprot:371617-Pleurochrysis_carterae.AAC.3